MASAKMASAIDVRIDDVGSILKFRIGFPFGEISACVCQSVWLKAVDTEFPYRVRIVDRGVDCRDPVCRHRFRFLDSLTVDFAAEIFASNAKVPRKFPRLPLKFPDLPRGQSLLLGSLTHSDD